MDEKLSHKDRAKRRAEIRKAFQAGKSRHDISAEFGVSVATVLSSCEGLPRPINKSHSSSLRMLAAVQNTTDTLKAIGAREGVTKQAVQDLLKRAKAAGMKFPQVRNRH